MREFALFRLSRLYASKLYAFYDGLLHKRPILTKCVTSATISFIADVVCQVGSSEALRHKKYKEIEVNLSRSLQFAGIGGLVAAPVGHFWYGFIIKWIPGTTLLPVMKRLFFDQILFAPIFLPCFFALALTLEGCPEQIGAKIEKDFVPTLISNYMVWLPAQFINFKYIATRYNVLFANFIGFFWGIYLSHSCYSVVVSPSEEMSGKGSIGRHPQHSLSMKEEMKVLKDLFSFRRNDKNEGIKVDETDSE